MKTFIKLLLLALPFCIADHLGEPILKYSFNLGRSIGKGNAVIASDDEVHVFVTATDGSLHIIDNYNVEPPITTVFEPAAVEGTETECQSGMVVLDEDGQYLIYAVINGDNSRLLAVDITGDLLWEVPVEGKVVGTPVVSANFIYVSANTDDETGYLNVFLFNGKTTPPDFAASMEPSNGAAPLGPPTVSQEGVVAVAESWEGGYAEEGAVYFLMPSKKFDKLGGLGEAAYEMFLATTWPVSSVTKPIVANDELWLGGTAGNFAGWQQNDIANVLLGKKEDIDPSWSVELTPSASDAMKPLLANPIMSPDQTLLFQPGVNGEVYCLLAADGSEVWSDVTAENNPILAAPVADGEALYIIEKTNGVLRQYGMEMGIRIYDVPNPNSQADVEADFSISPNDNVLYYGDVDGNIVAFRVAGRPTTPPTNSPTITPSPTSITASPTGSPASLPTDPITDDTEKASVPIKGEVLGLIIGAALILCAIMIFCVVVGRRRKDQKSKSRNFEQFFSDSDNDMEDVDLEDGNVLDRLNVEAGSQADEFEIGYGKKVDPDTPETLPDEDDENNEGFDDEGFVDGDDIVKDLGVSFAAVEAQVESIDEESDTESGLAVPPPPPPPPSEPEFIEEKKEGEDETAEPAPEDEKSETAQPVNNVATFLGKLTGQSSTDETPEDENVPEDEKPSVSISQYLPSLDNLPTIDGNTLTNLMDDLVKAEKEFFEPEFAGKKKKGKKEDASLLSQSLEGSTLGQEASTLGSESI